LPSNNGDRQRAVKDGGYIHRAEDFAGRHWPRIYLRHLRKILCRGHSPEQHGSRPGRDPDSAAAQTRCQVLLEVSSPGFDLTQQSLIYFRLSDNNRARQALRQCLPEPLRDATFSAVLRDDAATKRCLAQLLINLSDSVTDSANDHFD
jgi:hypothetical protein